MYNYHCPDCNETKLQSDKNTRKINEIIEQVNIHTQLYNDTEDFIKAKGDVFVEEIAEIKVDEALDNINAKLDNINSSLVNMENEKATRQEVDDEIERIDSEINNLNASIDSEINNLNASLDNMANDITNLEDGFLINTNINGFTKLPNGLIMQWGETTISTSSGGGRVEVTYPIAFPNGSLSQTTQVKTCVNEYTASRMTAVGRAWQNSITILVEQIAGTIVEDGSSCTIGWIAIGH